MSRLCSVPLYLHDILLCWCRVWYHWFLCWFLPSAAMVENHCFINHPHISLCRILQFIQCGLDPATQISSTPNVIVQSLISGCLQPMQLSWLPVLSNVAPPSLRRKAATDNMLQIVEAHSNWPVYADVFEHPPLRLASRCPIWSDMTSVDTVT